MYTREQLIALVQDHAATHETYPFNKINSHELCSITPVTKLRL